MASPSTVEELQEELKDAGKRLLEPPCSIQELLCRLDKVEHLLSLVDQGPSRSMLDALQPVMKVLVSEELFRHSDIDVKVSVASCITDITRITAPDQPYDDEQMKEIFELTVMALDKLSLASGRCYAKAVSILDTFAKVRSCLVMLDLECDELIIEMFQLFFNTIRSNHPCSVFHDMETVMTLVIEEIEEILLELLIPLLTSLKKENKNVSPLSFKLGESVLKKCAAKLRPCLLEGVQFMGIDLNDFADIVSSICQDASGREHSEAKELALDKVSSGAAGLSMDGSSGLVMNADDDSLKMLEHCWSKADGATSEGSTPKLLIKQQLPKHRNEREKNVDSSSEVSAAKVLAKSKPVQTKPLVIALETSDKDSINASRSHHLGFPYRGIHRTDQPRRKAKTPNRFVSSMTKGDSSQEKDSQSANNNLMKKSEVTRNLRAEPAGHLRKNTIAFKDNVQTTAAARNAVDVVLSDSEEEMQEPRILRRVVHKRSKITINSGKHARKELGDKIFEMPHEGKSYGEELVGRKIKVWWPLDRAFYEGAIYSFNPRERKHRVLYADGDEEILDLSQERWVLIGKNNPEKGQETDSHSDPSFDSRPKNKKAKILSQSSTKEENAFSSSKNSGVSGSKSKVQGPKCSSKSENTSGLDALTFAVDKLQHDASESYEKPNDKEQKSNVKSNASALEAAKPKNILHKGVASGDLPEGKLHDSDDA
ncbi:sister chromatid cohesion protein PDS5 homolog C-like isoform X3 [Diospyros lotus]|uniref:sister chromatid cohesion protein PDS5 homolog C-like isoform X3 n=1 Tax=Diospyros lotus TaxID=55363 RepID=UPI002258ECB5|nr:sister chromatid cohesion protein PDS5 homolog C-like isoform X3 [Diospyros lotus]